MTVSPPRSKNVQSSSSPAVESLPGAGLSIVSGPPSEIPVTDPPMIVPEISASLTYRFRPLRLRVAPAGTTSELA